MSDRESLRLDFLKAAGLAEAPRLPLPGDASTRRYERLMPATGPTLMLMDQAPAAESPPCDPTWTPDQRRAAGWNAVARLSAGKIEAFAAVAAHLKALGLSAPELPALDAANGLAVLEDFGDALFARVIEDGADETPLYMAAVEALAVIHDAPTPEVLSGPGGDWPLLTYDDLALRTGIEQVVEGELVDEDYDDVVDVVVMWWREDDGDLVDGLVDAIGLLADHGVMWLMTPKPGRAGHIDAEDIADAAPTAGLQQTSTISAGSQWQGTRLVAPRAKR